MRDSLNTPDALDKDLPLKEDTRLLGRVLGDVLRAQIGDAGLRAHRGDPPDGDRLSARRGHGRRPARAPRSPELLNPLPIAQALEVVRAFSYFSHLANIAEDVHQNRRRRAHALAGSPPRRGDVARCAVTGSRRRGVDRAKAQHWLDDALRKPRADRASDRGPAQEHPRRRARDRAAADVARPDDADARRDG